ncbi:hypothetical protein GCM10018980_51990 [Streptomyces capoamus]|uniref:Uncharacterized protein n=1 Tax=Streptomyces capoamus TaxID=68183 RepID=A0A919EZB1_9ACTN|nr:hypothetical protein [Streptomyces capoamus]GGW15734.1 hypothetical protein GCM10010501_28830 [Streptomyces libani subsp. rufus]GHG62221.1 hypothetical protein GCM10018980_51990 [Streptomyces capoamus]
MAEISVEDAFPVFQQKVRELFDANLLLQAQVGALERQLAAAKEENTRLQQAGRASDGPGPGGGPGAAARPPNPEPEDAA